MPASAHSFGIMKGSAPSGSPSSPFASPLLQQPHHVPSSWVDQGHQDNDHLLAALLGDVQRTRQKGHAIASELESQKNIMDALHQAFSITSTYLHRTTRSLHRSGLSNFFHIWFLMAFAMMVFTFVYFLMRAKR